MLIIYKKYTSIKQFFKKFFKILKKMPGLALIGTNGIETKADLARYLGVSRPRVTKVLRRLQP
jgi:DNA-binding MarR family transcriptional regulator